MTIEQELKELAEEQARIRALSSDEFFTELKEAQAKSRAIASKIKETSLWLQQLAGVLSELEAVGIKDDHALARYHAYSKDMEKIVAEWTVAVERELYLSHVRFG